MISTAKASSLEPYDGPFWVHVHAGGGWDPTSLCDPKGRVNEMQENPMNMYFMDEIGQAGNIFYAPVPGHKEFFDKYYQNLLILNGVDTSTNGHDSGTRNTWSGTLMEGHPSFTALVAGFYAPSSPMSFISNGGYDYTAGLVAPTRVGNVNTIAKLAHPNRVTTNNDAQYHRDYAWERIEALRGQRLESQMNSARLPAHKHSMNMLYTARSGSNEIKKLTEVIPTNLDNSNNGLFRQAQLAIAAYKAGIAVSANLSIGGFDTHNDHDNRQFQSLQRYLAGVDFVMEEAERQGVADKVIIVMGSDFGRTPGYNMNMGKDHWSITSMLLMGQGIEGNRVLGVTDDLHRAIRLNPDTLQPSANPEEGIRITPAHVHRQLRKLAGVSGTLEDQQFLLDVEDLTLFESI
jgi:hypothetical protein